jgi:hypothetical protein
MFGGVLRAPTDKTLHEIWVTIPGPVGRGSGMLRHYQSLITPKSGSSCNERIAKGLWTVPVERNFTSLPPRNEMVPVLARPNRAWSSTAAPKGTQVDSAFGTGIG